MRKPNIELHIGELVLHGFQPADRHRIGDAVQAELSRLVTERSIDVHAAARLSLSAAPVHLPHNPPARTVGAHVARALFGVLRR